jgi:hypothetical protein
MRTAVGYIRVSTAFFDGMWSRARGNQMKLPTFRGDPNGRFSENTGGTSSS